MQKIDRSETLDLDTTSEKQYDAFRMFLGMLAIACISFSCITAPMAAVLLQGEMLHQKQAKPGESYRGSLVLNNPDPTPGEVKLYQTDYGFDAEGYSDFGNPGQRPRSNAKWISLSRELVSVPPNSTQTIEYEVQVPNDKGLTGTYWSMIMIEPIAATSREAAGNDVPEGTMQISQTLRYGLQVVTHIGQGGEASLVFTNPRVIVDEASRVFTIDVENTGQRWLRPGVSLELYNESGQPIGKFQGQQTRLYPGTSARFRIEIGQIPKGKYLGLVVADGTGDNLFGANVELEIE